MTFYLLPLLPALALLQSSLASELRILGVTPNLVLMAVIAWATIKGIRSGLLWAVVGGLSLDLLGGGPMGASILALTSVTFLALAGEITRGEGRLFLALFIVFLGSLVYDNLYILIIFSSWSNVGEWWEMWPRVIIPAALINAILMPAMFGCLQWLNRRWAPRAFG